MRTKIYYVVLINLLAVGLTRGQQTPSLATETEFFNFKYWEGVADKRHLNPSDRVEFLSAQQRVFEDSKDEHRTFHDSELIWVQEPIIMGKLGGASTFTGPCTNIDFEAGNFTGWVRSTGFHPLFNAAGCCTTVNGAQAIMSGTGTDPYGAFPVVAPGGSFSLRLGNNAVNGVADRIEQTFSVTPQNANFTYRYAIVLNDNGHPVAQQPAFTIEMIDSVAAETPAAESAAESAAEKTQRQDQRRERQQWQKNQRQNRPRKRPVAESAVETAAAERPRAESAADNSRRGGKTSGRISGRKDQRQDQRQERQQQRKDQQQNQRQNQRQRKQQRRKAQLQNQQRGMGTPQPLFPKGRFLCSASVAALAFCCLLGRSRFRRIGDT